MVPSDPINARRPMRPAARRACAAVCVLVLVVSACTTFREESSVRGAHRTRTINYTADLAYPYQLSLVLSGEQLMSQYLRASDLTLVQDVDGEQTVSFNLALSGLDIIANLDRDGRVLQLEVWDRGKDQVLRWDEHGVRTEQP